MPSNGARAIGGDNEAPQLFYEAFCQGDGNAFAIV